MSTPLWVTTTRGASKGTATIEESDDTFTLAAHGLVNGQQVTVAALTGGASTVLVADAPYFVANAATNTFQLRPSPGGNVMTFASDGGCEVFLTAGLYEPQTMRNSLAGLLATGASSNRFIARTGVFPMSTETQHVTTTGMNWTVADVIASVRHATGGNYIVAHGTETGAVTAADPSQPRIDAIDLQIQDNALDSSGFARGRIVYTAGTPAAIPVAPNATPSAERLATFTVAAGATSTGTPTAPSFVVARGGILPVADSTAYPGSGGRYKGLPVWDMSTNTLLVNTTAGATYSPIASVASFQSYRRIAATIRTSNSSTFTSEAVITSVTAALESGKTYRVKWVVDSSTTVANDTARWRVRDTNISGTTRFYTHSYMPLANQDFGAPPIEFDYTAASTGNMTWVGTCHRANGTGTFSCNANANEPSSFTVDYVSG